MENLFEKACELHHRENYIKAFEFYRQAAEMGHGEAYKDMGDFYRLGKVVLRDVEKAARCYKKSAELGFKDGLYSFAAIRWFMGADENERSEGLQAMTEYYDGDKGRAYYEFGKLQEGKKLWNWDEIIAGNYGKAIEYYEKSAELGCAKGYYQLAQIYLEDCRWIKKDKEKALEYYKKAADMGEPNAWWDLGRFYKMGDIVEQDIDKFVSYFNKAAELGKEEAFIKLAVVYSKGIIVPKDEAKAIEYMVKYLDGDKAHAYYLMGRLYDDGLDYCEYDNDGTLYLPEDYAKAAEYYEKSAELGSTKGCFRLALLYEYGMGVKEDLEKARHLYERAIEKDEKENYYGLIMLYLRKFHDESKALEVAIKYKDGNEGEGYFYIGKLFDRRSYNDEIPQDCKKAAQYYLKSIELGCMEGCEHLAELYLRGNGVEQDEAKALEYMKKCGKGDGWAYYEIGDKFSYFDYAKAAEYYQKGADLGDDRAFNNLGTLYARGDGVAQDYDKARELFEKAVEYGNNDAYHNLANIYSGGLGSVAQDKKKALEYYELAARHGEEKERSKEALEELKKSIAEELE